MKTPPTRREFLVTAATATAGLLGAAPSGCSYPARPRATVIDTHTHFYDPTRPGGVPWPGRDDPFLYRPVLPEEFATVSRPQGVGSTLVVEASPWMEDNAWVLELADRHPALIGLVGHLEPGTSGFGGSLDRFGADPRFRGIRLGAGEVVRAAGDPALRRDLQRLSERGLALDVLVGPAQLGAVAALARAVPGLRLVVDHCANVAVTGGPPPPEWLAGLRECAAQPAVAMKVSGLVEGTGRRDGKAPADAGFYRPVLDAVWTAFGPDRVIYGSNWPVSSRFASYATVIGLVRDYFDAHGAAAAGRYFSANAIRIYGLPGAA